MKKVMIIGANGQLGSDIARYLKVLGYEVFPVTGDMLRIEDASDFSALLKLGKPDVVINTAAFHRVDLCEREPEKAFLINATAPTQMAGQCMESSVRFIHFSTDYVFDGFSRNPYREEDKACPLNIYGASKLEGEQGILKVDPSACVLRVSALYGSFPCRAKGGFNFVELMLTKMNAGISPEVVNDEWISPTYTLSIAKLIPTVLESGLQGIVHATSEGWCSWYDFAREIYKLGGSKLSVIPVSASDRPTGIKRPSFSVLDNHMLKVAGIADFPNWKEDLKAYMRLT